MSIAISTQKCSTIIRIIPRWHSRPTVVQVVEDFVGADWIHGQVKSSTILVTCCDLFTFHDVCQQAEIKENIKAQLVTCVRRDRRDSSTLG
jgi:hypothetical protein